MNSGKFNKDIINLLSGVRQTISEQVGVMSSEPVAGVSKPKMKPKKVIFDKSTGSPFEVVFSERGFLVEGTRFSFEELETAISKKYNIILNEGKGLSLDAVKMQKILKYKDVY